MIIDAQTKLIIQQQMVNSTPVSPSIIGNFYLKYIEKNRSVPLMTYVRREDIYQVVDKITEYLSSDLVYKDTLPIIEEVMMSMVNFLQKKWSTIDRLVYWLYNFTEEEIKIVEEAVKWFVSSTRMNSDGVWEFFLIHYHPDE